MNTPAFKAERMVFVEFLEQPSRDEKLSFVQDLATARDVSEGPIKKTDNTFDLAISGDGYFSIESPNGERYTRHGRF
jgi:flagellar basal-body rod protein FlgF